ncbi:PhoP regulatory network protein YrbL [compost metagenome]
MFQTPAQHDVALQAPIALEAAVLTAAPLPAFSCCPFQVMDLTQATLVATGSERDVYLHPSDKSLLVKIINRSRINEPGRKRPWHKRLLREDAHRVFISELIEYVATTVRQGLPQGNILMARISGLALTSQGLGLVVERIVDAYGDPAPTLKQIVAQQGFGPELQGKLQAFFGGLIDAHVIFNDVSARNIVVGFNASGREGLYLVDGFGPKQLLPLYAWSKSLNRRRLLRKYGELTRKLS